MELPVQAVGWVGVIVMVGERRNERFLGAYQVRLYELGGERGGLGRGE